MLQNTRKLCYRKDDRAMRAIQVDREPLLRYGHSKLSKMAAAAVLNLFESLEIRSMERGICPIAVFYFALKRSFFNI